MSTAGLNILAGCQM